MRRTSMNRLYLPLALGVLGLVPAGAHADGLAQILISKSIPESTVSVIDPETGSSSGGGTTDVNVGPGDIIQFRFRYIPVPDNNGALDGMQGYLTEYIPSNTTVVGVRILSDNGDTPQAIMPRFPGLSVESASGSSISQV